MNMTKNGFMGLAAGLLLLATTTFTYADNKADAAVHGNKGNELAQAAKYDEAIVEFTKAIELSPKDERLYADRGRVYRAAAKLAEALADFAKVIEIAPKSDVGYLERGQTLMIQNSYDLALVDYNKAIELNPNNPVGYDRRGYAFYNLRKYEGAIQDYTSSIEKKPDDPLTFNRRADAYVAMNQFAQAVPDLEAALKLKPEDFDTTQRLLYVKAKLAPPRSLAAAPVAPPKPAPPEGMSMPMKIGIGVGVLVLIIILIIVLSRKNDTPPSQRPVAITIICILGFIGAAFTIPMIFSSFASAIGAWYPPCLALSSVVGLVCMIGLWQMRKWAIYLYTAFGILNQVVLMAMGVWNIFVLLFPAIVIAIGFAYISKMR